MTAGRWLAAGASTAILVAAVAAAAVLGLAERARKGPRVPRAMVTGRAAAAIGDSGVFAMAAPPPGVRPVMALADAESAAVAFGYRLAPTRKVFRARDIVERPSERRRVCGRSFYVRPVVEVPDSVAKISVTANMVATWGPSWVVPVCDDAGAARTTVLVADAPTALRVVLGDQPGDVPELVFPRDRYGNIGWVDPWRFGAWDGGIALAPERAVAVAMAALAGTRVRIAEPPEAFHFAEPPRDSLRQPVFSQPMTQPHACPRWRLRLDRAVTLRGLASGQVVRTGTVYVAREGGCYGLAALYIPRPVQPRTLTFRYGVRPHEPDPAAPRRDPSLPMLPRLETRTVALRVTEPVVFEGAHLSH